MLKNLKWVIQPYIYWGSSAFIFLVVLFAIFFPGQADHFFQGLHKSIIHNFKWFYIGSVGVVLLFCLYLMLSRFGHVKLGQDHEKPMFPFLSWMAMLFSAGMGIGLLFYSVAEPLMHYMNPPFGEGQTSQAATQAMKITFFHWGLHAWGIYVLVGLALAYFCYRKGKPLSIRFTLEPLLKSQVNGFLGYTIDILAVLGTLFGVATSLGLGVIQINSGLNFVFDVPKSLSLQVFLIFFITLIATASLVSGVKKGIRRLSEINILIGIFLLGFVFFTGPTQNLLNLLIQNIGVYIQKLPEATFWTGARTNNKWIGSWTVFYWGWWIAWAPFVGMFIAQISRGRTIREFIAAVLFIPTLFTFIWMTVFGETALYLVHHGGGEILNLVQSDLPVALFTVLEKLPWGEVLSLLGILVIFTFFITSSDSGSFVIDMITAGGDENPPVHQKIYWAFMEGIVAAVLLVAGGLKALQTASITAALPFCFVMLAMMLSLFKALQKEKIQIYHGPDKI